MQIKSFDGQKKGEKIVGVWNGHTWVLSRAGFVFAGFVAIGSLPMAFTSASWGAGFLLLCLALGVMYLILNIYLYYSSMYILTNERILSINQSKLLVRKINEVPLSNIQNVSHIKKGLFQMLMDYGDVEIQTAGSTLAMTMKSVPHPYKIQQKILTKEESLKVNQSK